MADNSASVDSHFVNDPSSLCEPVDFDVRGLGRRLPRAEAPEGWINKVQRQREGKVWVGFFHIWTTAANGRRVRRKKEKTLGPASMPKHEALSKLANYIEEYTGTVKKKAVPSRLSRTCGEPFVPSGLGGGRRRPEKISATFLRNTYFRSWKITRRAKSR
jgi:hypothetical protein